jgi:hypothetical protein
MAPDLAAKASKRSFLDFKHAVWDDHIGRRPGVFAQYASPDCEPWVNAAGGVEVIAFSMMNGVPQWRQIAASWLESTSRVAAHWMQIAGVRGTDSVYPSRLHPPEGRPDRDPASDPKVSLHR